MMWGRPGQSGSDSSRQTFPVHFTFIPFAVTS